MKKKELLSMKKLEVTKGMKELVAEDRGKRKTTSYSWRKGESCYYTYKRYQYYRAVVEGGILKVAIFMRKYIAAGCNTPQFEIYISKEANTWTTYEPASDKWYTAKIDNLQYDYDSGWIYGNKPYATAQTKNLINTYLDTGSKEVKDAILTFQASVRKEQLYKKYKSELEEIDAVMNAVPELPKDFDPWVLKYGFINCRYIFYHAGKYDKGYCSYCDKTVPLKIRPYHNTHGKCPVCGSEVTFKAWNKQKYISDEKNVGIMQKLTDGSGYILRKYFCRVQRKKENEWKTTFSGAWEEVRVKLDENFRQMDFFEWGQYKYTGIDRWCHNVNHGMNYYYYDKSFGEAVMYSSNIKKLLKDTKLRYMPVKELLESARGKNCGMDDMLQQLIRNPKYEFLIKAGMKKIVFERCGRYSGSSSLFNESKKKPWEYMKITKEQFKICCDINAGEDELRVIQIANDSKVRLTGQQVSWIARYLGRSHIVDYMAYSTPHKMIRYMKEKLNIEQRKEKARDYGDYLEECGKLGLEYDEQTLFPQNFERAHEMASEAVREIEDKKKSEQKKLQDIAFRKSMKQKEKLYQFEDDMFTIVLPKCKDDFQNEGREMHNCVGGYFERVKKGECVVLFLRKKEEPAKSYITVEIKGTTLMQCRTAYNNDAPEDAMRFMRKFLRELSKRLLKEKKDKKEENKGEDIRSKLIEELAAVV